MEKQRMCDKKQIYRVFTFLCGVLTFSFLIGCNSVVIEQAPIPEIEMHKGYTLQLTAPSNGQWVSDNPSVATVSSTGLVTAVSAGKATISIYSSKGGQTIVCYIEISPKRNLLFYIATDADAGIDGDTPVKINEIRAGWKPEQGEMLIYVDRRGSRGASLLRINETLSGGLYGLDTLQSYGVENSADSKTFKRFIDTVTVAFPADSYGLIFFSHASGWLPKGMLSYPRSLVIDNGGGTKEEMEYTDFAAAIPDNRFDFIIFEACLMADVMSMYELRQKTKYVLASSAEIVAPGFTSVYRKEIMRLFDTKHPIEDVVSGFAQTYYDLLKTSFADNSFECSLTLGLIKMSEMQNLAMTVKAALGGKRLDESTLTVDQIQRFDRPKQNSLNMILGGERRSRYFDLGQIIQILATELQYAYFHAQLEKTVVWKESTKRFLLEDLPNGNPNFANYDGFVIERHSGLTTYIIQEVYPELNQAYRNSSWFKAIY